MGGTQSDFEKREEERERKREEREIAREAREEARAAREELRDEEDRKRNEAWHAHSVQCTAALTGVASDFLRSLTALFTEVTSYVHESDYYRSPQNKGRVRPK